MCPESRASGDDSDAGGTDSDDGEEAVPAACGGIWMPIIGDDPGPNPVPFTAAPGPIHPPPPDAKPIDYVNIFLPPAFIDNIVQETN